METHRERVLVTGSSGFIGSAVVQRFAQPFTVIGLDRPGAPHPPPAADCIDVDLSSEEQGRPVQAARS